MRQNPAATFAGNQSDARKFLWLIQDFFPSCFASMKKIMMGSVPQSTNVRLEIYMANLRRYEIQESETVGSSGEYKWRKEQ